METTPPPTTRTRRRQLLRQSPSTRGPMSIEEYLVRTDSFRFTTSPNPLPYPLRPRLARSASSRRLKGSIRRYAGSSVLGVSPDTCFLSGTSTRLGIPAVVGTAMGVMSRSRRYVLTFMMMMMVKTQLRASLVRLWMISRAS